MTNEELLKRIREAEVKKETALDLSGQDITALPPELFRLINLTWLNLSGNQISYLSPEISQLANLTRLHLSGNKIAILPKEIWSLKKLKDIYFNYNPIVDHLPPEIISKGMEAIRYYFSNLQTGEQPLNEVKVLLVGDGGTGKTSLIKQLLGEKFDLHEDATHGINIRGWDVQAGGEQIKVNIWDFGGQEIMHATHQFFLSKRSLYVLVLDTRKDERAEYWLKHIEAFGGDSPILVVINKIDSIPSFDLNRTFLREKYLGIRDFFRISCKNGSGVSDFKKTLLAELAKIPMLGIRWPTGWFVIKHKLEQMKQPYINADEYKDYCAEAGVAGEENCETLIEFLHDLGVAVHFKDFILDAMHVLDPVWVTNAVYAIITARDMDDSKGFLRLKNLCKILPQPEGEKYDYPVETYYYIITLMKKFGLCYAVGEEAVLIPQLLPVPEPEFIFDYSGSLCFAFHYPDFLPPSVFPRFVVKVHQDIKVETREKTEGQISKEYLRWRTGVVLEDKVSGTQAVVKTDIESRQINIWVHGKCRREYLHYLRYLLADINNSFEKLDVRECVPMPDDPARTADYENLLDLAKATDIFIPVGSKKQYSVRALLGLVQPQDANELVVIPRKMGMKPDEKKSFLQIFTSVVEMKAMPPFIDLNISELFKKILEWDKQRQHEKRR